MHIYNAWLPPPVADLTYKEKDSFRDVLKSVKASFDLHDEESVYSTLKFISVLELFVKAKSELDVEDVAELVLFGLQVFLYSSGKLHAQVRWGNILVKFLNKYRSKLSLKIDWRPLYETLVNAHFTRSTGPEGWRLRQRHFETITALARSCRRFFPPSSASDIWSEFGVFLENPWHDAAFEGAGLIRLFLPTNPANQEFYTTDWIKRTMNIWESMPNCQFWNNQWAAITARVIKNYDFIDWESFLPGLFSKYLNMFEVPVANGSGNYPFAAEIPKNMKFLFSNKTVTPAKAIAKSVVYLITPRNSALQHLEKLVNFLEQHYHPSNGGHWTYSLARFLFHLVFTFRKRLQCEQLIGGEYFRQAGLGNLERADFVKIMLKMIDRGQYSKNDHLSETVASAISMLSYVEPSLVLPFVASRFHLALETTTATHQLKASLLSIAYAVRPILFSSVSNDANVVDLGEHFALIHGLPMSSLSNALLGIDANDPPKTLAAMHLIGSIFSNIFVLNNEMDKLSTPALINFSEWLDEFLYKLLALLQHLEPNNTLNEGLPSLTTSGTFLVEDGIYYNCMIQILLGKLSKPLYNQALERISKFVRTNILPGAVAEVGLLCCACVYTSPEDAVGLIVEPVLDSIISSLKGTPGTGFCERAFAYNYATEVKSSISPALETSIDYQLKMLSVTISFTGPSLLKFREKFKEAIQLAFNCPSWKVNGGGDHLLRSLLGSLIFYYPLDQYKCNLKHPSAEYLEKWISAKDYVNEDSCMVPKWHVPSDEEVQFANELLHLHLGLALDDLAVIFQNKLHSDSGDEREHLKVTLLRIDSSVQGVLSCLPDFRPSTVNGYVEESSNCSWFIAGAMGAKVGSSILRENAAAVMHSACKFFLEEKSDDSILLILLVRILDALVNYGSLEYEEWSNHRQSWKLESAAIVESPTNFIVSSHQSGKKRPSWALIDKAYMHNTWRASQAAYHRNRTNENFLPSEYAYSLLDDLLCVSVHSYETVRALAAKALVKLIKRWPSMISKCVHLYSGNLLNAKSPECVILGSCAVLSSQTVLKHLSNNPDSFSSFVIGILSSYHHESLKCQKAINALFVKFNIHFSGLSLRIFKMPGDNSIGQDFLKLISKIESLSYEPTGLHWRYNLMANRVLLLLAMDSRSEVLLSSKILPEVSGHFLKNLTSQLPQTRILAISALNALLKESSYKLVTDTPPSALKGATLEIDNLMENMLSDIFKEQGFFRETLSSLSNVHIISDQENASSRGAINDTSIQSLADKSITRFYFDFIASWPRTRSWISTLGSNTFYPNFARIFKRLVQECGMPVLSALRSALEEFANAEERSKQCVAAESLAGVLHSDVDGLLEAWTSWISDLLRSIMLSQSVESIPEWAACIRYIVTGKGKIGTRVPLLRQPLLDSLFLPLPPSVTTLVIAKRYTFLSAALIEISPPKMPSAELEFHSELLKELLDNMIHSSAQVRKAVGVALSVVCSNISLYHSFSSSETTRLSNKWSRFLTDRASEKTINIQRLIVSDYSETVTCRSLQNGEYDGDTEDDVKWMETLFHFVISTMKSGRSSYMLDVICSLLYPVISLQETSKKDLSNLAKSAFELLKWCFFWRPHLQVVVGFILTSFTDSNWRVRSTTLTYLRTFMYRHNFILSRGEKQEIWSGVEKLLIDNQVEVREHAASVLSDLIRSGDEDIASEFRERAASKATAFFKSTVQRGSSDTHGAVLALAASVLSVPYDMPAWLPEHVTLLARFAGQPPPVKSTVTKAVAEFRRTHADTWSFQKECFTEDQLEVLADTSSSSSYFA